MKVLVTLFLMFLVEAFSYDWGNGERECAKQQELSEFDVEELYDIGSEVPEDDVYLTAFLECSWKKLGMFNENGDVEWEKVHDFLTNKLVQDLVGSHIEGDDAKHDMRLVKIVMEKAIGQCNKQKLEDKALGVLAAKVKNCITATNELILSSVVDDEEGDYETMITNSVFL